MTTIPDYLKCKTCGESKPTSQFHQKSRSKSGYATSCRTCVNASRRHKKPGPPGDSTRLKTLVKKGDVAGVMKQIGNAKGPVLNGLLVTCTTPYFTYPKSEAHAELVRHLIQNGADPDTRESGEPVLIAATKTGRKDLVDVLLEGGATVDFFSAAATFDIPFIETLLKKDASLGESKDIAGFSALHYCAGSALWQSSESHQKLQLDGVAILLKSGANPNREAGLLRITPLVSCCTTGGSTAVIRELVRAGANPNHPWALRSALRHFKRKNSAENIVADMLLQCGCHVDCLIDDRTCLHLYSHHEEKQAVAWLLNNGASVHATTPDGRSPLHMAAERNNHTSVVRMLIEHGASITLTDAQGLTPIDYATVNGKERVVRFLSDE